MFNRIVVLSEGSPTEVAYAGAIAEALRLECVVVTRGLSPSYQAARKEGAILTTDSVAESVRLVINSFNHHPKHIRVLESDGTPEGLSALLSPQDLVISNTRAASLHTHAVLAPQNETAIFREGKEGILFPLGDNQLATTTYHSGLRLSRHLLPPNGWVTLYHTTWKKPRVHESAPNEHVSQKAKAILLAAEQRSKSMGITTRLMVRTDETVVHGIAEAALRSDASLVVVTRDPEVVLGDYADQLASLLSGSVPLLILPN